MLHDLDLFNQFSLTDEDGRKSAQYDEERKRKEVRYSAASAEEYIRALHIRIVPEKNNAAAVARISQMTQKTNQFNLTTKRYGEKEIAALMENADVYSGDVSDKFGDYGRTVLAIVTKDETGTAMLDTFLMSCRVMGRGVEYAFVAYVGEELRAAGIKRLSASFIPTKKNEPARAFLGSLGFGVVGEEGGVTSYTISVETLLERAKEKQGGVTVEGKD